MIPWWPVGHSAQAKKITSIVGRILIDEGADMLREATQQWVGLGRYDPKDEQGSWDALHPEDKELVRFRSCVVLPAAVTFLAETFDATFRPVTSETRRGDLKKNMLDMLGSLLEELGWE